MTSQIFAEGLGIRLDCWIELDESSVKEIWESIGTTLYFQNRIVPRIVFCLREVRYSGISNLEKKFFHGMMYTFLVNKVSQRNHHTWNIVCSVVAVYFCIYHTPFD